jgi:hypothetical protein
MSRVVVPFQFSRIQAAGKDDVTGEPLMKRSDDNADVS